MVLALARLVATCRTGISSLRRSPQASPAARLLARPLSQASPGPLRHPPAPVMASSARQLPRSAWSKAVSSLSVPKVAKTAADIILRLMAIRHELPDAPEMSAAAAGSRSRQAEAAEHSGGAEADSDSETTSTEYGAKAKTETPAEAKAGAAAPAEVSESSAAAASQQPAPVTQSPEQMSADREQAARVEQLFAILGAVHVREAAALLRQVRGGTIELWDAARTPSYREVVLLDPSMLKIKQMLFPEQSVEDFAEKLDETLTVTDLPEPDLLFPPEHRPHISTRALAARIKTAAEQLVSSPAGVRERAPQESALVELDAAEQGIQPFAGRTEQEAAAEEAPTGPGLRAHAADDFARLEAALIIFAKTPVREAGRLLRYLRAGWLELLRDTGEASAASESASAPAPAERPTGGAGVESPAARSPAEDSEGGAGAKQTDKPEANPFPPGCRPRIRLRALTARAALALELIACAPALREQLPAEAGLLDQFAAERGIQPRPRRTPV